MRTDSTGPASILVVEDDPISVEFIKSILNALGYGIAGIADTADKAVALVAQTHPSAILMDIHLAGPENGISAARRIHESNDVPVIYLTSHSDDQFIEEACASEPYAYLLKPARDRELRAAIETSLLRVRMERRLRRINQLLSASREINHAICEECRPEPFLLNACETLRNALGLRAAWIDPAPRSESDIGTGGEQGRTVSPCSISLPIRHAERRFGTLCLHADDGTSFSPEEMCMLEEIAGNVGLGLSSIEAHALLTESEARYRCLFENNPTIMILLDPSAQTIVDANPAAIAFYGWPREAMRGKRLIDVVDLPPAEFCEVIDRAQRPEGGKFFQRHRRADGSLREVEVHAGPIRMGEQRFLYFIVQDISVRKQLEEDLRQASKMEAIGRLAGGVAHDFNNILQAVLGNVELAMISAQRGEPVDAELKEILDAGKRAAEVTRQLLAFSRRQTIQPKRTDINSQIKSLLLFLKRVIGEHVSLDFKPGDNLPPVMLDSVQLDQALLNLCANARDAMPNGGTVQLETAAVDLDALFCSTRSPLQPGKHVRVRVADQGIGMPRNVLLHIFEPFFTTKELGKGTGLGLATVFGILIQHGGWIEADSIEGQGTTFDLYWPCAPIEAHEEGAKRSGDANPLGGTESILVVEDEPGVQLAMRRILASVGYQVLLSPNGRHALERLRSGLRPSLAIIDMVMPEMGGMELSRILESEFPSVRYLLCSAHPFESLTDGFPPDIQPRILQKPFTFNCLLQQVRNAIDGVADPAS